MFSSERLSNAVPTLKDVLQCSMFYGILLHRTCDIYCIEINQIIVYLSCVLQHRYHLRLHMKASVFIIIIYRQLMNKLCPHNDAAVACTVHISRLLFSANTFTCFSPWVGCLLPSYLMVIFTHSIGLMQTER